MGAETLLENDASQSEMRTESPPPFENAALVSYDYLLRIMTR